MKKTFMAVVVISLFACNTAEKETPKEEATASTAPAETVPAATTVTNLSGYSPTYSASFQMGDVKNAEAILTLYKNWDNGNLEPVKNLFSDSISFFMSDGTAITTRRDSAIATMQVFRNNFAAIKNTVHALFPVKSADKGEDWVCIWATEYYTNKKGNKDSAQLQETWRFDKNGKIDLVYQYASKPPKPKK